MVRLIDADELMKTFMHEGLGYQYNRVMCAPTVDAVPVIRCKDCKHYADECCDRYADETLGYVHSTQESGYCWVAERKEE